MQGIELPLKKLKKETSKVGKGAHTDVSQSEHSVYH